MKVDPGDYQVTDPIYPWPVITARARHAIKNAVAFVAQTRGGSPQPAA